MIRVMYVVTDEDGDMIGVDQASGGYPFKPATLVGVKFWRDFDEAAQYVATMTWNKPDHNWEVREAELVLHNRTTQMEDKQDEIWIKRNGVNRD